MNNEKFGGEAAFNKLVIETLNEVDVTAANKIIDRLNAIDNKNKNAKTDNETDNLVFTDEDDEQAREMVKNLQEFQRTHPNAKQVRIALIKLIALRNKLHAETV